MGCVCATTAHSNQPVPEGLVWKWGNGLEMVWKWFGNNVEMVWKWVGTWFGNGLEMVWKWFGNDLEMVWKWFGNDLEMVWKSVSQRGLVAHWKCSSSSLVYMCMYFYMYVYREAPN
jgi:hypothetical protein